MPDPLVLPSLAVLTGGGWLARDYLKRRLDGSEDRYMALYGHEEWDTSNMDLAIRCKPDLKGALVEHFLTRLDDRLHRRCEDVQLLLEEADVEGGRVQFRERPSAGLEQLLRPRRGVYLDLEGPDGIRVVFNHMQTDGVGMWNALRRLFDPNPPLFPYRHVPPPPPFLPELLALPSVARRLVWKGRLGRDVPPAATLTRSLASWDAGRIRNLRDGLGGSFNLVTCALAVSKVFDRHPNQDRLNVGVTGYFPFLNGRNKYGVFLCRVRRSGLPGIVDQLTRQTQHAVLNWGRSAAQSYALSRLPDRAFARLVGYYRRQVDVLVTSLPVGQMPITLGGIPTVISCHPWELTLPYYFLLVGTRQELHVSMTSRFPQTDDFLDLDGGPRDFVSPIPPPWSLEPGGRDRRALS